MKKILCLRQFNRPTGRLTGRPGIGDCTVCAPHEDNKNCVLYYPISVVTWEVKDAVHKTGRSSGNGYGSEDHG